MSLDLSGIENVEFYSGHYLSAVLEGDLQASFKKWADKEKNEGIRPPYKTLASLATRYFTIRSKADEERSSKERWRLARDFHVSLLDALGYPYEPSAEPLDGREVIPVMLALQRDSRPFLWIIDAPFPAKEDDDALSATPLDIQLPATKEYEGAEVPVTSAWRDILTERVFRLPSPPRWVLFLAGREAVLIERHKWAEGRYLRFELGELLGRKETQALRAMAGLLHRDVLAPDDGLSLHDTLDENSHKHAFAVSSDLKHGVRRAVELLANEAVWYRREIQRQAVFQDDTLAPSLTSETLTWLYRLLFLFYVEARGAELGVVPMGSDAYRNGYSLETLRELELVALTTPKAREGYFIHESLQQLFRIINQGYPTHEHGALPFEEVYQNAMVVPPLRSPLFDDDRLTVLKSVRFRNHVLQEVLQLLSLSAEVKNKVRGRISYAQLGINQLGAVYEGLLSYTGFFATEDLFEVAAEADCQQLSGKPSAEREALKTYFVPASRIPDYKEGEIVRDENDKKVVHKKGTFIFRLAGRNREKSASYYTPEVLTKCLVKYALKELLWEEGEEGAKPTRKKTADEILALTICEPAMGSSAFLIEAVDQLADAYLEARQEEVRASGGETILPEDYQLEKRRVKARLATNNCYGVDLNPTAVELAKVSLWLATLHEDGKCPWFGLRLATGNSLVGARREVFKTADVTRKGTKDNPNWLGLVPEVVPLYHGENGAPIDEHWTASPRPKDTIYHFLLPAEGMAAFDKDKVIKQLAPESVERIKEWSKEFCKPFSKKDADRLEQISDAVDRLFAQVVRERVLATQETSDRIPVWGEPPRAQQAELLVRDQEEVAASLEDGSSAYRRLKLAMDAWCALWFWPIEEAGLLPDRATWLAQMELILKGRVTNEEVWKQQGLFTEPSPTPQSDLPSAILSGDVVTLQEASNGRLKRLHALSNAFHDRRADYFKECGLADIDLLLEGDASLRAAQLTANRLRFLHWPLRFAEVFAHQGGFDMVLGNPPWIRLVFEEAAVLGDFTPLIALRRQNGAERARRRAELLREPSIFATFLRETEVLQGQQGFFNELHNYPELKGLLSNLYKCFMLRGLNLINPTGVCALVHQKGVYDDPRGSTMRQALLPKLSWLFHFSNKRFLFDSIEDQKHYEVSVLRGSARRSCRFYLMCNLYHPVTIDESLAHDGRGEVPGIRDEDGNWVVRGHRNRLVTVDEATLRLFAALYDSEGTKPSQARIPVAHSEEIVQVLAKCATGNRLRDLVGEFFCSHHFGETAAQEDGTLIQASEYPTSREGLVLQGPHFYVGNPLAKTPNAGCRHNQDYCAIDLTAIPDDYLPRTNFIPGVDPGELRRRSPSWLGEPLTTRYRHVHRRQIAATGERTLVSCIIPPGPTHVDFVVSTSFRDLGYLCRFAALTASVPIDFFMKTTGRADLTAGEVGMLPFPTLEPSIGTALACRALRLNCVTQDYSSLWEAELGDVLQGDSFAGSDNRLARWRAGKWRFDLAIRTDFERRQALVEIDVLAAMSLGMTLGELIAIYTIQFPVMQTYERQHRYDAAGRLVPSSATFLGEECVSLVRLGAALHEQTGFDVHAEYHPDGSNTQEIRKQKIGLGKKEADVLGVPERCTMADLLAETEVRWSDEDHPEGRPVRLVGLRYTDPGLEPRMERVYPTPWTHCDREADYRQAWAEFERRLAKKMPEGTPL